MKKLWAEMTRQEKIDHLKEEMVKTKSEMKDAKNPFQKASAESYLGSLSRQLNRYYR